MNSPTDPKYAIKGKSRKLQKKLAKEVVNYLEDHMLPAPHDKGKISISTWKNNPTTTVKWQKRKTIYQIETQKPAINALKMAVFMKSFS